MRHFDTIIVGGGAAAYAAAIYAKRYDLSVLVVEGEFGGETALAGAIENYPGFESIDGFDLMKRMKDQATKLGAVAVAGEATLVRNSYHCFRVKAGEAAYDGKTIILATGMEHRKLGLAREDELRGKGIHYCATCDGPLFKGKRVGVVGGGDSAVKWANQLADVGVASVTMFVREQDLSRAEPINRDRLATRSNVTTLLETAVTALQGGPPLASVRYRGKDGQEKAMPLDGLFVAIGAKPRGALAKQLGVRLAKSGEVAVDPRTMATSVDGVFAAGDLTDASGSFKQIVTGAAQGAIAATSAYADVQEHGGACSLHAVPIAGLLGEGRKEERGKGKEKGKGMRPKKRK